MTHVTCHVSRVTCHVSHVIFFIFKKKKFTIPPKKIISPMIRIGREIQCLPYAGFFMTILNSKRFQITMIGLKDTAMKMGDCKCVDFA